MTSVINLFGGPGAGKSTAAAAIFAELKMQGCECEMALEFAKDLVWENRLNTLSNQIYVFGKQLNRMVRLKNKVDFIITDSPVINSVIYKPPDLSENFDNLVLETFNSFSNINFFIHRRGDYFSNGRLQDKKEALKIDAKILQYLNDNAIPYHVIDTTIPIVSAVVKTIRDSTCLKTII